MLGCQWAVTLITGPSSALVVGTNTRWRRRLSSGAYVRVRARRRDFGDCKVALCIESWLSRVRAVMVAAD